MPNYLLPCTCGQKTVVSAVQAGETIRCGCGALLQVPSMRGLRDLEHADAADSPSARRAPARRWEDRHRAAFSLVVAALVCLVVAGFLWTQMPQLELPPAPPESGADIQSVNDAFRIYNEMQQGLPQMPSEKTPEEKTRQQLLWGIGVFVALAALAGAAALGIAIRKPQRRKKARSSAQEPQPETPRA